MLEPQGPVLVFHNQPLIEAAGRIQGYGVHFAYVDRVIAGGLKVLHPRALPGASVMVNTRGMGISHVEKAGTRRHAGRRGAVAMVEGYAFADKPIQVGRLHDGEAKAANRVVALLIRDEKNNVGACHRAINSSIKRPRQTWSGGRQRLR